MVAARAYKRARRKGPVAAGAPPGGRHTVPAAGSRAGPDNFFILPALCVKAFVVNPFPILLIMLLVPALSLQGQILLDIKGLEGVAFPERVITADQDDLQFNDTLGIERHLAGIISALHSMAHLEASVDSLVFDRCGATAYIHAGARYGTIGVCLGGIDREVLGRLNIRERRYERRPVDIASFRQLQHRLLTHYENNGYPFASVALEGTEIHNDTIRGRLTVQRNRHYRIDSIHVYGDTRVERKHLYRHIGIVPGDPYSEKRFRQAGQRIRETGFFEEIREPEVEFMREEADLYLYLNHRQSGSFNGIIGLAPSGSGGIRLAGEAGLDLANMFNRMERIGLHWQSPGNGVQQIDIELGQPYLFGRAFGADLNFHMFRQDSAYLRVEGEAGIPFTITGGGAVSLFGRTSSVMVIAGKEQVPGGIPAAGVRSRMTGLSWRYRRIDNLVNPRRGWSFRTSLGAGSRSVTEPGNQDATAWFAEGAGEIRLFIPVATASTIMLSGNSAGKLNIGHDREADHFYAGELYLLGGIHTIRGFDERSIAATEYFIPRVEYRYLFDATGNIFLFFDGLAYRARLPGGTTSDTPFGLGTGITVGTRAGQFTISYAVGRELGNPFSFRSSRVHMGVLSRF
ncbi:MAG: hypothetical protein EA408_09470 [Marinilabiliales bacterium]|nr:MAG: hypothetical protein EA408_09470 [Marinilabiliales bacterium]